MESRDSTQGVLVVDDDAFMRTLLLMRLQWAGFRVTAVANGAAALEAVKRDCFAAVILDFEMPGMNGIEVARRLRCHPTASGLAIVMHTAIDEPIIRVDFTTTTPSCPSPAKLLCS